ncbi:hypothetical protein GGR54DRAFT_641185 [Hypoxylon sp. NC1633]|nr:hypothetical protein GGR54DRAFT_641185 [Hypoxylon sp. NC1633]
MNSPLDKTTWLSEETQCFRKSNDVELSSCDDSSHLSSPWDELVKELRDKLVKEIAKETVISGFFLAVELLLKCNNSQLRTDRCLMTNCSANNFTDSQDWLDHLKRCQKLTEGLFRYNVIENFQTASKYRAGLVDHPALIPWMSKFNLKIQEKLKDFMKSFTSSHSDSKVIPAQAVCQACGQPLPHDVTGRRTPRKEYYEGQFRLPDIPIVSELQGNPWIPEYQYQPPFCGSELPGSSCSSDLGWSSSLSIPPAELSPESAFRSGACSTEISPTFSADSSMTACTDNTQYGDLPADLNEWSETGPMFFDSNHADDEHLNGPQTQLIEHQSTLSSFDPMHMLPFPGNPGLYGRRGPSLKIKTNSSTYELAHLNEQSWLADTDTEDDQAQMGEPISDQNDVAASSVLSLDCCSHLTSANQPSNLDQAPSPAVSKPPLKCPDCNFVPKGKEKNFPSYLRKHLQTHQNPRYTCSDCGRSFTRRDNQKTHAKNSHPDGIDSCSDSKRRRGSSETLRSECQKRKKSTSQ